MGRGFGGTVGERGQFSPRFHPFGARGDDFSDQNRFLLCSLEIKSNCKGDRRETGEMISRTDAEKNQITMFAGDVRDAEQAAENFHLCDMFYFPFCAFPTLIVFLAAVLFPSHT